MLQNLNIIISDRGGENTGGKGGRKTRKQVLPTSQSGFSTAQNTAVCRTEFPFSEPLLPQNKDWTN